MFERGLDPKVAMHIGRRAHLELEFERLTKQKYAEIEARGDVVLNDRSFIGSSMLSDYVTTPYDNLIIHWCIMTRDMIVDL